MYTAFYGLREKPFALSPDPRFLYLAASHREALAHLLYGIEQGEGFISVTGEVGTGKTTLCRTLLERLEGDIELAFLFNPSRSALELLQSICAEFGLPAEGLARRSLMSQLNKFLLEQKERGRRVLLIIDEAQTLSENTLEQVRLLSNLETSREKLIQILLLGQPELDRKLDERGLRQLRQRISVRWKLEPLSADETVAYVRHRIAVAAGEPRDLFSEVALRDVHRRTGGIPRLVNQLCDRALLAGYATRAAQIGPALIRAAAREIPDVRDPSDRDPRLARNLLPTWVTRPWMYFALTLFGVGLALITGLLLGRSTRDPGETDPPALADTGSRRTDPAGGAGGNAPPAVGARGLGANASAPLGRLIGYVGGDEAGRPSAELRATDGQLAAAGVGLAGTPGLLDPLTGASSIPALGRSAIAPGLLPTLLAERAPDAALSESERAFLDLYDVPYAALGPAPANASALAERLEARGLVATAFEGGSFEMLRRLDHPVLIPLAVIDPAAARPAPSASGEVAESDRRWLALTGFDGDRVWLAGLVPGRVVSVALAELAPRWLEAGVLVWKNHESLAQRFEQGGRRESIEWLQEALGELQIYEGPVTGEFDAPTAAALRDFQRRIGLVEDGLVGPLTQIALYAELPRYPVPRLSASAVRPRPALPPVSAGPPPVVLSPAARPDLLPPAAAARPGSDASSANSANSAKTANTPDAPRTTPPGDRG
ncbi:MAG: AAA family ATPase [Myxococcota bacterium]